MTQYEDLRHVSRHPEIYSSALGATNIEDRDEATLAGMRLIMINMDPPQHVKFRRIVQRGFTPQMIQKQEAYLRDLAKRIVDPVAPRGEAEFVEDLAAELPLQVICELVGTPEEERRRIFEISNKMIGFDDPEFNTNVEEAGLASAELAGIAMQLAERYKNEPSDNLTYKLLNAEVDGERLMEAEFCWFFLTLARMIHEGP
ncbi:MAG: cytochrome P450 [bacterium]|nr:cytochrome P450 [bacterium]